MRQDSWAGDAVKAVKVLTCGATYLFDWLPCVLPKGHAGLHHGEVNEPGRKSSMDWIASLEEVRPTFTIKPVRQRRKLK